MFRILAESIISGNFNNAKYASEEVIAASCSKFLNGSFINSEDKQQLIRSKSDKFDYRLIKLENGIRILLISDPSFNDLGSNSSSQENVSAMETSESEHSGSESSDNESMSSCSSSSKKGNDKLAAFVVGVDIGSFEDPREFQGMAHMLEHMMSMGSEAFPSENIIDEFLSSRGGYANAHTECEYTCYEIKVHRRYLKEAINLFGKAFVSPLLRQESIEREIKPVDTEFIQASNDDDVRMQHLLSHLANPQHPINKFLWGNRKSLITDPLAKGLDIRKKLVEFFQKYYKPENIVVVVQSQESLSNLQEWTVNVFSEVKTRTAANENEIIEKNTLDHPFDNSKFNRFYIMESINSGTRLHVSWCLPSVLNQYLGAPFDYLTTLIGHEGKGSLLAELRKQDLAIELVTDSDYFCFKNNRLLSLFTVEIFLTDKGAKQLDEVVKLFFEYIAVIRKIGAQEYFFRENQTIALKSFNSKSERDPLSYSIEMAKFMMNYPVEHILTGYQLYYYYNKQSVDDLLAKFLPETANFIHIGGEFKSELSVLQEPWMETKYQEMPVPPKWNDQTKQCLGISECFHYPKPNPFIASKFDLVRDTLAANAPEREAKDYPVKIYDTARMTVWHKSDFKFNLPKASIHIHIMNPCVDNSLENVALSDVLFEYLMLLLKEDSYDAQVAGLSWNLQRTYNGIHIQATGFNHKLADLVLLLLQKFKTIEFDPTFTESIKKEVTKFYNNDYQDPEDFNRHLRLSILMERFYTFIERWTTIASITKNTLVDYKQQFLSNLSFEILVQGNMAISETMELTNRIKLIFDLDHSQTGQPYVKTKNRVAQLPTGTWKIRALTLTAKNRISHVVCYYQLGPYNFHSCCYLSLFVEIVGELCFNTLRTKEGLGYNVGCVENDTFGILGFNVYVSSCADKFDCTHIEGRIEQFVDKTCYEYVMEKLSQSKFEEFVSSAIKRKEAPDLKLDSEVSRHVDEINSFDYCFDRVKREIDILKKASLNELKQWASQHIFLPSDKRKLLTIQIAGNGHKSLEECVNLDKSSVNESLIPSDTSCKPLYLLLSKDTPDNGFIQNVESFKKQLELYPPQKAVKDI